MARGYCADGSFTGNFDPIKYARVSVDATQACCACGGGVRCDGNSCVGGISLCYPWCAGNTNDWTTKCSWKSGVSDAALCDLEPREQTQPQA